MIEQHNSYIITCDIVLAPGDFDRNLDDTLQSITFFLCPQ